MSTTPTAAKMGSRTDKRDRRGCSSCSKFPNGKRRFSNSGELAPRSQRRLGRHFMSDCNVEQLKKAGVL